jgi:hypothetical protein
MRKKGMAMLAVMAMVLMGLMILVNPIASCDGEATISKYFCPKDEIFLGRTVTVVIDVYIPIGPATVEDHLPDCDDAEGLSYVEGSFKVDGILTEPVICGKVLSTEIAEAGNHQITFDLFYDSAVPQPDYIPVVNKAYLKGDGFTDPDPACATLWLRPYCGFYKYATLESTADGDMIIEVGEEVVWTFMLTIKNKYATEVIYNVVVTDRLAAELEVDDVLYYDGSYPTIKKQGNTKITWEVGTLYPGEDAQLYLQVSTRKKGCKQAYTSCGRYEWNSGGVVKFNFDDPDGVQLSAHTKQMWVDVPGEWPDEYDIPDWYYPPPE